MPEKHYTEQVEYANSYLLPYFKKHISDFKNLKILEIGCAEAGTLELLKQEGHQVTGVELDQSRIDTALKNNPGLDIRQGDISSLYIVDELAETYDLIIMREVIEHIPNKGATFYNISRLLKKGGYLFVTFPPKYSPFAGHQQVGKSILRKTPYIHLLPSYILKFLLKVIDENRNYLEHVKSHYSTGMSISKFEMLTGKVGLELVVKDLYLFRPIYKLRYGTKVRKLPNMLLLREFITFGYEGLLRK